MADGARLTLDEASRLGGRFAGRPLYAEVVQKRTSRGRSTVLLWAKPAGAWSIKTYGRRGGYVVRPRGRARLGRRGRVALRIPGAPSGFAASASPSATRGDGRWDDVVRNVTDELPAGVAELVDEALDAGEGDTRWHLAATAK